MRFLKNGSNQLYIVLLLLSFTIFLYICLSFCFLILELDKTFDAVKRINNVSLSFSGKEIKSNKNLLHVELNGDVV